MTQVSKRNCYICGAELRESFGLVKAGDFLRFIESKMKNELISPIIRETCFKCSFSKIGIHELKQEMEKLDESLRTSSEKGESCDHR